MTSLEKGSQGFAVNDFSCLCFLKVNVRDVTVRRYPFLGAHQLSHPRERSPENQGKDIDHQPKVGAPTLGHHVSDQPNSRKKFGWESVAGTLDASRLFFLSNQRVGESGRRFVHLVPAPAVRLMKRRVQSRPGSRQENRFPGLALGHFVFSSWSLTNGGLFPRV